MRRRGASERARGVDELSLLFTVFVFYSNQLRHSLVSPPRVTNESLRCFSPSEAFDYL